MKKIFLTISILIAFCTACKDGADFLDSLELGAAGPGYILEAEAFRQGLGRLFAHLAYAQGVEEHWIDKGREERNRRIGG